MIVDPQIGTYATAYFDMPKVRENQYINIFGMEDIRHFMKTGHLPGVFDHYFYVESIELRKEMLENFHKNLLAHTRQYYMVNEKEFKINSSFGIDVFGQNKVAFCSTSDEFPLVLFQLMNLGSVKCLPVILIIWYSQNMYIR